MASFSMAFTTDKAMNIVYAASTDGWPEGEAYLVVKNLMKKYRPQDTASKIEMRQQLARIKMKKVQTHLFYLNNLPQFKINF
jgi:hypothetical protein